jgi:hypothetical protein
MSDIKTTHQPADQRPVSSDGDRAPIPEVRVAAPRPSDAKDEGDGLTRLIANNPADDANPRATDVGIVEKDVEEKVVEGGVEAATESAATAWSLTPHSI